MVSDGEAGGWPSARGGVVFAYLVVADVQAQGAAHDVDGSEHALHVVQGLALQGSDAVEGLR